MASKNQLLGSGREVDIEEDEVQILKPKSSKVPAIRYHKDHPQGLVIHDEHTLKSIDADQEGGWSDYPAEIEDQE